MPIKALFDGYVESMRRVSSQCLIRIDRNRYCSSAMGQSGGVGTSHR